MNLFEKTLNLLVEEPRKLERLIIQFVKLSVTIYLSFLIMGYEVSYLDLKDVHIENYSIPGVIVFITITITTWYILWWVIADLFFFTIIILCISILAKIIAGVLFIIQHILFKCKSQGWKFIVSFFWKAKWSERGTFLEAMDVLNVIKRKGDVLHPEKGVVFFNEFLNAFQEEEEEIMSLRNRLHEYVLLLTISFIIIMFVPGINLPTWAFWVFVHVFSNTLILFFIIDKGLNYISNNLPYLQREFAPLAYIQQVHNAADQIKLLSDKYTFDKYLHRFGLTIKQKDGHLPNEIRILIAYHSNIDLAEKMVTDELNKRNQHISNLDGMSLYAVIISNVKVNPTIESLMNRQSALIYVNANTQEEIHNRLEEAVFEIQRTCGKLFRLRYEMVKAFIDSGFLSEQDYESIHANFEKEWSYFLGGFITEKLAKKMNYPKDWVLTANEIAKGHYSAFLTKSANSQNILLNDNLDWQVHGILSQLLLNNIIKEESLTLNRR